MLIMHPINPILFGCRQPYLSQPVTTLATIGNITNFPPSPGISCLNYTPHISNI